MRGRRALSLRATCLTSLVKRDFLSMYQISFDNSVLTILWYWTFQVILMI